MNAPLRHCLLSLTFISLLAGCGGSTTPVASTASAASPAAVAETPTPTTTPTPTPKPPPASPSPMPSPSPDTVALGAQYLAVATPLNAKLKTLDAEQGSATKTELKVIFAKIGAAYREAIASLKLIIFPLPIQADVDKLITTYATLAGEASKLAANPDHNPGSAITDASAQAHLLATRIRAALGLPPPPSN